MSRLMHRVGWIGLCVVAAGLLFAVVADLAADRRSGLPSDHAGAFAALAGSSFDAFRTSSPGVASYVTTLEVGYALHELTFTVFFLLIVLIPLRRRQAWAWWGCWALMIANLGYPVTIARHDPAILPRSLVAVVAVPVLLLMCAPAVLESERPAVTE